MRALLAVLVICFLAAACNRGLVPDVRERIAQDFRSGKLAPDAQGVVLLPSDLTGASIDGRAFVTTNQVGSSWLLLRTWRGKGANMRGYLFAPGASLKLGSEVAITTDAVGVIVSAQSTVEKDLGASWYIIYSGYD